MAVVMHLSGRQHVLDRIHVRPNHYHLIPVFPRAAFPVVIPLQQACGWMNPVLSGEAVGRGAPHGDSMGPVTKATGKKNKCAK